MKRMQPRTMGPVIFLAFDLGCTDPTACNYVPEATYDNGICLAEGECEDENIEGCTYENAENYEPSSTVDDGSCIFPSCEHPCGLVYDGDFNAEVGASDLLNLLTEFGQTCD